MDSLAIRLGLTALAGLIGLFLVKLYRVRSHVRSLQRQGLPMPPHSFLLGHLPVVASIMGSLPSLIHGVYIADQIRQKYPEMDTAFYLDIWPIGKPYLMVIKPDMIAQFTQSNQLPKDPGLKTFLGPLAGKQNLVTMEGPQWKRWRSIFNPGFSASHISSLVPAMVEKVDIFKAKLEEYAKSGEMFLLEDHVLNLTIDIIGGAVMDHDFQSQSKYNDMTSALRTQLRWATTGTEMNPIHYLNVFRPFMHMYNTWRMNRYLNPRLDARYNSVLGKQANPGKSVIDLALKAYLTEDPSAETIPTAFKEAAIAQIKLFIFAGHDTTSSATIFTYDLLAQHPLVLSRVRAEHDAVFGPNIADAGAIIAAKPQLLNQLPYTVAAIKEAMRIYPTVAALRIGTPDLTLVSEESGQRFPTADCIVLGDHYGVHHNPAVWPEPESYRPERWMVGEEHPLYPPKNAWRPFERGPRNCIGMELAMTEMKIIFALTLRRFDVVGAYEEWDRRNGGDGKGVNGRRNYMVRGIGGGHPAEEFPCRVSLSGWGERKRR